MASKLEHTSNKGTTSGSNSRIDGVLKAPKKLEKLN